jgi:co-chaperonin GroES (HSP10)
MEECMHFRPLHDRVVVKRIDSEEKLPVAPSSLTGPDWVFSKEKRRA